MHTRAYMGSPFCGPQMIYTAEIHLKSWRVIFTPFIGGMLHQLAKEAMTGLLQHIDGTNITPS